MHTNKLFIALLSLSASLGGFYSCATHAMNYGIYDARAMAMGGTAIAIGSTAQAAFYNPALLAFHAGDEDKTTDGRTYFPTLVAQAANTIDSALKAVDDNLDGQLSDAVSAFNGQSDAANAGLVADASHNLRKVLDKIANKDLTLDAFVGLSVSEPGDHEGGAFYMGARAIGAGTSTVTATDLALLDEYIGAMEQMAAGATLAAIQAAHPTLIDTNGQLVDPTDTLNSSADVGALVISEWGLALAKEFTYWGQAVAFGITPKMMRVDAYRDNANFNNSTITSASDGINQFSDTQTTYMTFNADLGIAAIIAEHYRVSFAMKDVFAKDFATQQAANPTTGLAAPDLIVKLRPRSRMGLGYVTNRFSLGLDYDLQESTPIASEAPSQDISLGAEYQLFSSLALRVGYRQDKTGLRANSISGGIGYHWRRLVMDLGYAQSSDMKGGGLQLGWTF
jgi:hypothetical protein